MRWYAGVAAAYVAAGVVWAALRASSKADDARGYDQWEQFLLARERDRQVEAELQAMLQSALDRTREQAEIDRFGDWLERP